ncbi:MAG: hypothetical protein AB7V48_16880 [Sedimentibacter sp.]
MKENQESWGIRKQILQDVIDNGGYDNYGCHDPMTDLLEVLCNTKEEYLEKADIMMKNGMEEYQKHAAKIYYKYGREEELDQQFKNLHKEFLQNMIAINIEIVVSNMLEPFR